MVIATSALSDAATILNIGSEAAAMPAANLQAIQPTDVWRATALGSIFFEVDFGAAQKISLIGLLYTNATTAATWRIRAAAVQANLTSTPDFDSTTISLWQTTGLEDWGSTHGIHWIGAAGETWRYWRIDVTDAANPDGHFQAGRLVLDDAWQPTRNANYGLSIGWVDRSSRTEAANGALYPLVRGNKRAIDFSIDLLSETEVFANAFQLGRKRGITKDVLVVVDPDDAAEIQNQSVYGLLTQLRPVVIRAFDSHVNRFRLVEML